MIKEATHTVICVTALDDRKVRANPPGTTLGVSSIVARTGSFVPVNGVEACQETTWRSLGWDHSDDV
jgi:hypothetical protein